MLSTSVNWIWFHTQWSDQFIHCPTYQFHWLSSFPRSNYVLATLYLIKQRKNALHLCLWKGIICLFFVTQKLITPDLGVVLQNSVLGTFQIYMQIFRILLSKFIFLSFFSKFFTGILKFCMVLRFEYLTATGVLIFQRCRSSYYSNRIKFLCWGFSTCPKICYLKIQYLDIQLPQNT